jgi:hypothetical protein
MKMSETERRKMAEIKAAFEWDFETARAKYPEVWTGGEFFRAIFGVPKTGLKKSIFCSNIISGGVDFEERRQQRINEFEIMLNGGREVNENTDTNGQQQPEMAV